MELALYCPNCGYYEKEADIIGQRGDFYTSVSVGPVFGELLSFQFADWLTAGGVDVVEAGAHRGDLARDVLRWLESHRPELFERLRYWIVEPSARRRAWQEQTLATLGEKVTWATDFRNLVSKAFGGAGSAAAPGIHGIIFCNELLDAMPIHRLGWDSKARCWFEWGVTAGPEGFQWTQLGETVCASREGGSLSALFPSGQLENYLPERFTVDVCPAAQQWWCSALAALGRGRLLTIDYGLTEGELLVPERVNGTARAFCRHKVSDRLLAQPGEQDITAHVNFTALRHLGEAQNLQTEVFDTQGRFLTSIFERVTRDGHFGEWTASRVRQFQTLIHPGHLGRAFRVLVQQRR